MKLPDEDKLKQRVMHVLAEWDQLLLNDFSDGGWARTFPELYDFSLVYVSKSKVHGERYASDTTVELLIISFKFIQKCECLQMVARGLYTVYKFPLMIGYGHRRTVTTEIYDVRLTSRS